MMKQVVVKRKKNCVDGPTTERKLTMAVRIQSVIISVQVPVRVTKSNIWNAGSGYNELALWAVVDLIYAVFTDRNVATRFELDVGNIKYTLLAVSKVLIFGLDSLVLQGLASRLMGIFKPIQFFIL